MPRRRLDSAVLAMAKVDRTPRGTSVHVVDRQLELQGLLTGIRVSFFDEYVYALITITMFLSPARLFRHVTCYRLVLLQNPQREEEE